MKRLYLFLFPIQLVLAGCAVAKKEVRFNSPDGDIEFTLKADGNSQPTYSVAFRKSPLIGNSPINLELENKPGLEKAVFANAPVYDNAIAEYELVVGKVSKVKDRYNQALVSLHNESQPGFRVDLEIRIFNDGLAFRYLFPKDTDSSSLTLLEERTQFLFTTDPIMKALLLPNFSTSHEGLYTTMPLSQVKDDTLIDMPALFEFPGGIFMAITEAALLDYAGMYLMKKQGKLSSQLSPLPGHGNSKVKATFPHKSPWRVLLIGDRIGTLIESNIITSLNEPSRIKDTSWIKPGTSTFPWWNGTIIPESGVTGGNNFETNKYYIDFCAANNIKYHTVVEYGGHEWYTNDGTGYQPGKNVDITKPVPGLDMKAICDYGKQKNVGIRVWTHWKALYPKLDTAFAIFEKWGLSGMMVDFMDRDDQEMVNIQTEILEKAAKHHLHIQWHGAYKPTGLSRTWPNEFTREGTLNYEVHKWDTLVTPSADLDIVFTRSLAGSTDYHLGGFRALPQSKFKVEFLRPYVMGTRCHMLAMYVVLENYLPMVCDYPDAYIDQPGFEVIRNIPATWDETKVPAARVDEYVSIARRKKDNWYVGTITNNAGREISLNFNFLPSGNYAAEIYSDAEDAHENANNLTIQRITIDKNSVLKLKLAPGGGNIIVLNKIK